MKYNFKIVIIAIPLLFICYLLLKRIKFDNHNNKLNLKHHKLHSEFLNLKYHKLHSEYLNIDK